MSKQERTFETCSDNYYKVAVWREVLGKNSCSARYFFFETADQAEQLKAFTDALELYAWSAQSGENPSLSVYRATHVPGMLALAVECVPGGVSIHVIGEIPECVSNGEEPDLTLN